VRRVTIFFETAFIFYCASKLPFQVSKHPDAYLTMSQNPSR
jgi:hypothetical protein